MKSSRSSDVSIISRSMWTFVPRKKINTFASAHISQFTSYCTRASVRREFRSVTPHKSNIHRWDRQLKETGSLLEKRRTGRPSTNDETVVFGSLIDNIVSEVMDLLLHRGESGSIGHRVISDKGLLLVDIMSHGITINSDGYVATLKKLQVRLSRVRRHREKQDVLLLHDNAQSYVSHKTTDQVVVTTEDVQNVHLLLEYRPHIDVSLTCVHDPKLQEYCVWPQNMPQFDSERIPNQAPETNKPMILNGPTSRNREGSDQVSVEAKQLGHLYLSIDQETFDPSTGEPYD
ncbi:hypothetical protein ANN_11709 [Periplaneta americana]|uniref:DUF4817 domain-containing protein n=1 Tax=Periplaneta americana TaxID=6978 RepID=A0ABQ8T5T7_PERAM|nr:hypothetical protein ANN_11709 [Periplaneta americana]